MSCHGHPSMPTPLSAHPSDGRMDCGECIWWCWNEYSGWWCPNPIDWFPEFIQFEWNDYAVNGCAYNNASATTAALHHHGCLPPIIAALARIETKAKIMAADVTGSSDQDAAAEKLLSRLEGTRNDWWGFVGGRVDLERGHRPRPAANSRTGHVWTLIFLHVPGRLLSVPPIRLTTRRRSKDESRVHLMIFPS